MSKHSPAWQDAKAARQARRSTDPKVQRRIADHERQARIKEAEADARKKHASIMEAVVNVIKAQEAAR